MKFLCLASLLLTGVPLLAQSNAAPENPATPQTAKDFSDRAQIREDHGDLPGAIADLTEAIRLHPNDTVSWDRRGYAESRTGDWNAAMSDYNQSLKLDAKDWDASNDRANAELAQDQWDVALSDYNAAIKLNPQFAHAYNGRGNWCVNRGDLDQARTDFTEALSLDPKYGHAFNGRGLAEFEQADFDHAISDFSEAIRLDPNYAHAYGNRGVANFARGHFTEAWPDLNKSVELEHGNGEERMLAYLCLQGDASRQASAAASFRHDLTDADKNAWSIKLARFVLGDLSGDDLVKAAFAEPEKERKQDECQAYCYIAAKAEVTGDAATADKFYRQAVATDVSHFTDYIIATVKVDTEPSAVPVAIMPAAVWINGTVKKQGDIFLFSTDRPVTGDTMKNVVLLGTRPADKNIMPDVYDHVAQRHLTVRFYGCLVTFTDTIKNSGGPVPNVEFIAWKMHLPGDPDVSPEKQREFLHDGSPY
jgi:lipoprotein NlpI